jgi:hypothetical protein
MKSVYEKLVSARQEGQRVHVTLSDGTALPNCSVADIEGTTFTLTDDDGDRRTVRRSQLAHVHVLST